MMTTDQLEAAPDDVRFGDWVIRHLEDESQCIHPRLGQHVVRNPIRDHWRIGLTRLGGPLGASQEMSIADRTVHVMDFERGTVVLDLVTGSLIDVGIAERPSVELLSHMPQLMGRWGTPYGKGTVGAHAILLHTNEVLFLSYWDSQDPAHSTNYVSHHSEWSVLDLWSGKQTPSARRARNQFCGGHCLLDDGTVLLGGGDRSHPLNHKSVSLYEPVNRRWLKLPDLAVGRWYPTIVAIGGRDALLVGGDDAAEQYEGDHRPNPTLQVISRGGATLKPVQFDAALTALGSTYPFVFVLPGGSLFVHFGADSRLLNLNAPDFSALDTEHIKAGDPNRPTSRTFGMEGTAVLLPLRPSDTPPYRARIMMMGGGSPGGDARLPANETCELLDLGEEPPHRWKRVASMINPRVMPDAVLLPDGTVLVVNGTRFGSAHNNRDPVYQAELYDPKTDRWHALASMAIDRRYHATALLLPDATVLVAGTDRRFNAEPQYAHDLPEVFSPPYLYWGPRPLISRSPVELAYGESFVVDVNDASMIQTAVLMRNGSCTHSFNSDQRCVELQIVGRAFDLRRTWTDTGGAYPVPGPPDYIPRKLSLKAPPDRYVAPAGYYMLFLISRRGVPSIARFVRLDESRSIFQRLATAAYSAIRWLSDWATGFAGRFIQRLP